mmetsp:Transcript_20584/g.55360  ORF Transcript_20584/g.55360 Transcript_20584/m.55360 type:complete len:318 (+) Transcript_20584:127-1080(+)
MGRSSDTSVIPHPCGVSPYRVSARPRAAREGILTVTKVRFTHRHTTSHHTRRCTACMQGSNSLNKVERLPQDSACRARPTQWSATRTSSETCRELVRAPQPCLQHATSAKTGLLAACCWRSLGRQLYVELHKGETDAKGGDLAVLHTHLATEAPKVSLETLLRLGSASIETQAGCNVHRLRRDAQHIQSEVTHRVQRDVARICLFFEREPKSRIRVQQLEVAVLLLVVVVPRRRLRIWCGARERCGHTKRTAMLDFQAQEGCLQRPICSILRHLARSGKRLRAFTPQLEQMSTILGLVFRILQLVHHQLRGLVSLRL